MEVTVTFPGGPKSVSVQMGNHLIISDSSTKHGGEDLGPPPGQYMIAALLLCTASTARGYCVAHDFPVPAGMRAEILTDANGDLTWIRCELLVNEDFPETHFRALIRAAETCWVKKQWLNPPEISTEVHLVKA